MAQKVQVLLVDDIDAGEATETLTFSLDGVNYEIDLSDEHAAALREAFAPWVGHARRVGGRTGASRKTAAAAPKPAARAAGGPERDTTEVRTWARENGYTVSDRGRISAEVLQAFDAAH
ncbi:histone-like nucleoid-structuring protein Lsr2 [Kineococcus rhizosphaerae]|uniref:Lsr2 protein n=1 Tax=Kineococcus rhizosphaerae TaxID=559628 RepID=A0A2T0R5H5_9ACTN|nr:Lsr2 family protein [Kineococcus rhizosphaerae]PRY16009.1 Lsr2 protein [Kineococcus rhizosphaerae]